MLIGATGWIVFEVIFLAFGVAVNNETVIFLAYAARGMGYPPVCLRFPRMDCSGCRPRPPGHRNRLVLRLLHRRLPTLGALIANGSIPVLGPLNTLWLSLGLVVAGSLVALLGLREKTGSRPLVRSGDKAFGTLSLGLKLMARRPKVLCASVIRMLNTAPPQYGSFVFFPVLFADRFNFGLSGWLLLTTIIYAANIPPFNVIFGMLGDRIGWRNTVRWFGAVFSGVSLLALYYLPVWTGSYPLAVLAGIASASHLQASFPPSPH